MPLGDPEEIDAILTSYKMGLEEGERQTVEKIVAWLHNPIEMHNLYVDRCVAEEIAAYLVAGEWK